MPDARGRFKGISVPELPWLRDKPQTVCPLNDKPCGRVDVTRVCAEAQKPYKCPVEGHECVPPEGRKCCLDYEEPA